MKDLYRRNGLKPLESDTVKINNCKSTNSQDNEAAFVILLNGERKQQYDRVYSTLNTIARLRDRYALTHSSGWSTQYGDFVVTTDYPSDTGKNDLGQLHADSSQTGKPWSSKMAYSVIAVLFVLSVLWVFNGEKADTDTIVGEGEQNTVWKHAIADKVPIYELADSNSHIVGEVAQFDDTRVFINKGVGQWDYLHYGYLEGYVRRDQLQKGNGEQAYIEHCRELGVSRPPHGSSLLYANVGPHTMIVINPPGKDALIKLKDKDGSDKLVYYLHGGQTLTIKDVPEGVFEFFYATGNNFSLPCKRFLDEMQAWKDTDPAHFKMEMSGQLSYPTTLSYSLKNQFAINRSVESKYF